MLPDGRARSVQVKVRQQPPPPSWVENLSRHPGTTFLIVTNRMTPYLRNQAQRSSLDVIDVENEISIIAGITFTPVRNDDIPAHPASPTRGRKPWVRWATERLLLLADGPMAQADMAAVLAVSQQSISHVLRAHRYARRSEDGWGVEHKSGQLEEHLREYPGAGGATTYWFELGVPLQQAKDATAFSAEMDVTTLQTGDVAADTYAPWRLPLTASVYTSEILDFTPAGFTPAANGEHTLKVTVAEDPTIWRTAEAASHTGLADPVITLYDVLRSPGPDSIEAADRLRETIIDGTWRD